MMNTDNLEDFKNCYDYSKENQKIYYKYIESGIFSKDVLEIFEKKNCDERSDFNEDSDEWEMIEE